MATTIGQISKLAAPGAAPPQLPAGTVRLYPDDNWNGEYQQISIDDRREGARQSLAGTSLQDVATYVAFNLPVGSVMTLMDNDTPVKSGGTVADLSGCGRCVDSRGNRPDRGRRF